MRMLSGFLLAVLASQAQSQTSHLELVAQTPCLEEYRAWFFSFRRPEPFPRPPQFTREQCDEAARVHERIADEQHEEAQATKRRHEEQIRAAEAERAQRAQQQAREMDAAEAARAAETRRLEAALRAAEQERAARAKRPGARLGMSPSDVIERTNWGRPVTVNRTTTASGVREQWVYSSKHYLYFTNGVLTAIQD